MELTSQALRAMYAATKTKEVAMAIANRDLPVGTRLAGRYKKQTFVCTVQMDKVGGTPVYVLEDGKEFKSLSSAGSAVMGGGAVNGWRFWSVEGEATTANVAADSGEKPAQAERKPKSQRKAPKFKPIKPMEEQPFDLEEGAVAYWCPACQRAFIAGAEMPAVCPEGHKVDDPELSSAPALEAVAAEAADGVNA
jgi:hypothetical protein